MIHSEDTHKTHEPLLRVMSLHALAYCERLFYLEEVEEIRVADFAVYAGRTLHEELRQDEEEDGGEWTSLEVASETLGLIGKIDSLRRRDGSLIPYEHKRGRPLREGKIAYAWPSDALQITAYGMLLEEEMGQVIPEGRVRYHEENVTVRVPVDETARSAVFAAIRRARTLRASPNRPPVAKNDRLCIRCSLAPVCLPEEERLANDPSWEPIRLFPPDREVKTIHVTQPGVRISRAGDTLKVAAKEGEDREFPVHDVGAVVLHGYPQITTQALHLCARNDIAVHWLSGGGRYVTGTVSSTGAVQRRLRQYKALSDELTCLNIARKLVMAKVENSLRYVLRVTREERRDMPEIASAIEILRQSLKRAAHAEALDSLRGHEGVAGRAYFSALAALVRTEVPEEMRFSGRNRRPPRDPFNALLGFGYSLLYQTVLQAIVAVGLEPSLGFFHTPRSSAHPLVLDLMELFRLPIWDIVLLGSVNRMQWESGADFSITKNHVWLSDSGRKKAIELFEKRLAETWKHPVVSYSLSYARLIELEVRLLEKEWAGSPGLFAQMRLR
ncbi:MAG: type I-MYXAN CRISPR-associated endonuclease Cas1 [Chloroflexota bacterium]|nr:type I-MYXAN CRISPR-associated endonuclease Cas1 [Chloroflexota bacterium]